MERRKLGIGNMNYSHESRKSGKFGQGNIIEFGMKIKWREDLGCCKRDDRIMRQHSINDGKKGDNETTAFPGWGPERPRPSLPCAGRGGMLLPFLRPCLHSPFFDCYAVHAFSVASDLHPKLIPKKKKKKNQMTIREVCAVIQSLLCLF